MGKFKEYHLSDDLVDRTEEYKTLRNEILEATKTMGTIICANTGVGKTALSDKIVHNLDETYQLKVSIKTDPENTSTNCKEGKFLSSIFIEATKETHSLSPKKKYSFEYFISHNKNRNLKKARRERFIEELLRADKKMKMCKLIIIYILSRLLKIRDFNSESLINEDCSSNIRIMNYYLQYLFSNLRVFLKIDNIQNIDELSLTYIISWLNEYKHRGHYFLFEYTLDKINTFSRAIQIAEKMKEAGVPIKLRKLDFLVDTDALAALKKATPEKKYSIDDEQAIMFYYNHIGCGNIRKLLDYNCDDTNDDLQFYDPTYEKLRYLEKEELYVVAVVILCNGSMSTLFYEGVFQDDPLIKNKIYVLEKLCDKNHRILELSDGNIKIEHASIIDTWNKYENEFMEFSLLGYSRLQTFLRNIIESETSFYISKHKATILLLQLYKKYNFELIVDLLDEVEKLSRTDLSVNNVWEFIKIIIDSTKENAALNVNLYLQIAQICYRCELYENGLSCLEILESRSKITLPIFYILKCLFLSALDRHRESIIGACAAQMTWNDDSQIVLNTKLILLNNFRSLNNKNECKTIGMDIEGNSEYKKYPEYGYFLRLSNLYLDRESSTDKIRESAEFFHKIGNDVQEGKSLIAWANHLALNGQIKEAKNALSKANRKLKNTKFGYHMILVNKAAINLLDGEYTEETWDLLDQAELSTVVPFDKLAVLNNKLIWCIENKSYTRAELITNQIDRLFTFEPDKHLLSFMNYNLYLFYTDLKMFSEADIHYKKADKLKRYCTTLNLRMTHQSVPEKQFLLNKRWHVCFLEYWTFDILMQ